MQPTPQDNQLMSKHRVLSFKPHLRLEGRGQDGQSETEQPNHSASLGDSITASTQDKVFGTHRALFAEILKVGAPGLINVVITNMSVVLLTGVAGDSGKRS